MLMVAMLSTAMGQVAGTIDLTFVRTGTTAKDPTTATVTVANSDSETTGIAATITSNYAWQEMSTSGYFTNTSILCPNKNGNSIKNNGDEIVFTITLNNVPEDYTFGDVTLTSVGASAGGGYQGSTGGRTLTFTLKQGDTTLGTADQDIKVHSGAGATLKFTIKASQEYSAVEGTLTLTLTLANKSGAAGCFYGLMKVSLATTYASEDPDVYKEMLQATIDEANDINWGTTVGTYNKTTEIDTAIENANNLVASSTDIAELEAANTVLSNLIANPTMNMPKADKVYQILSAYTEGNFADKAMAIYATGSGLSWKANDLDDLTFYWYIEPNGEGYSIKNASTMKYAVNVSSNTGWITESDKATAVALTSLGSEQFSISTSYYYHCESHGNGTGTAGNVIGYNGTPSTNGASAWYIVEVESPTIVTYNFTYKGETKFSQRYKAVVGNEYPDINESSIPYGVDAGDKPTGRVSGNETVTIELSLGNLPFEVSESFDAATWYYLQINSGGWKYVNRNEPTDTDESTPYDNLTSLPSTDNGLWAFSGNPFDGFQIWNKGAGEGYTLSCDDDTNGSIAYMKNEEKSWTIQAGNDGFVIRQSATACLNDFDSQLKFWNNTNSPNATGSAFRVSSEDVLLSEWKTNTLAMLGYVGAYPTSMADDINAVETYAQAVKFDNDNKESILAITDGGYYRIQHYNRHTDQNGHYTGSIGGYMNYDAAGTTTTVCAYEATDLKNANAIWKLTKSDKSDKAYTLQNPNTGLFLAATSSTADGAILTMSETAEAYEFANIGDCQHTITYSVETGKQRQLYIENQIINGWTSSPKNTVFAWYIIPATELEVSINEFASICLPFDVVPGEGVEAYAITAAEGTSATLTQMTDIPANEGAILAGNGTATLSLATATTDWSANKLEGTTVNTYVNKDAYVLAKPEGKEIGLYRAKLTGDSFLNNANKAYLPATAVPSGAQALRFTRGGDDETTSIDQLINTDSELVIYDLAGRRVQKMEKGIYIVNGKKVIK